jgi:hypothetical protein
VRPILAVLIWIVLIGGLTGYMQSREIVPAGSSYEQHKAKGLFSLQITTTFPVEPDPFALQIEEAEASALLVKLNGKEILRRTEKVEAGVPIRIEPVPGLVAGGNEFYLEANPPVGLDRLSCAVRVQLLQGPAVIADTTLWSDPGARIASTFQVAVESAGIEEDHHNE